MLDIDTRDLLESAENALTAPGHLTPTQEDVWHNHTLRNRMPLVLEALRIAGDEGDAERAIALIDQAVHDYPAPTRIPGNRPVPGSRLLSRRHRADHDPEPPTAA
ncbi:hypothetical protein ABZ635_10010 [Nocardiopsis sp. NPDC007018]|uniref:hypothetical protein n=1 Tax=Nocardiopsis sp. NPDC007018 TaxID=3155721 RepID=UPI0033F75EB3